LVEDIDMLVVESVPLVVLDKMHSEHSSEI
jgi:hypothetical protein